MFRPIPIRDLTGIIYVIWEPLGSDTAQAELHTIEFCVVCKTIVDNHYSRSRDTRTMNDQQIRSPRAFYRNRTLK
jgi:hypothetical protein